MNELFVAMATLGWMFWGLAGIVLLAAIVSVENEKFSVTTPVVVLGVGGLIWLSGYDVLEWAKHNVLSILIGAAIYLMAGVVYGVLRYMFYVHRVADRLEDWANSRMIDPKRITKTQASSFAGQNGLRNFPLKVSDSKGRITFWMIYWPFSAPWTLINEPVKRFFNFAYTRLSGLLQGIADRAFRGVEVVDDEPKEPKGLTGGRQQLNG